MAIINSAEYEARRLMVERVQMAAGQYSPKFQDWLLANWPVWLSFRAAADRVRERGLRDYSAYVIVNVLRWRADTRGEKFSMTNTMIPDLARLYNAMYGPLFKTSTRFGKETS